MKNHHRGLTVVELLVWIAVISLIAAPFLVILYGKSVREWEHQMIERIGVPLPIYYAILIPIGLAVVAWRVKQLSRKTPSSTFEKYSLPDENK